MPKTCTIRPVILSDLPDILIWRNHLSVRQLMFTQHEITQTEHKSWFQKASQDNTRRIMMVEENKQPIGFVQFSRVAIGGVASWGFYKAPGLPKGTGRKLGVTALEYAFDVLRLRKVCGQAIESNTDSIGFHQALGFIKEGVLSKQCIDAADLKIINFGLTGRQWALIKPHLASGTW